MNKLIFVILIISITYTSSFASVSTINPDASKPYRHNDKSLVEGETLLYVVKYMGVSIGEIRVKVTEIVENDNQKIYKAIAFIDSYEGLPFVDLHQIYQTEMNTDFFSQYFKGLIFTEKYTTYTEYFFDYEKDSVKVVKGKVEPHQCWTDSTGAIDTLYQDGLSLFYFARMYSGQHFNISIPCLVKEDKVRTEIQFSDEHEPVEIDAVDYEIDAIKLEGYTDFTSIFGLTGDFDGYFTADEAAIPLTANLQVIIGAVSVELIEWNRETWTPPKYQE